MAPPRPRRHHARRRVRPVSACAAGRMIQHSLRCRHPVILAGQPCQLLPPMSRVAVAVRIGERAGVPTARGVTRCRVALTATGLPALSLALRGRIVVARGNVVSRTPTIFSRFDDMHTFRTPRKKSRDPTLTRQPRATRKACAKGRGGNGQTQLFSLLFFMDRPLQIRQTCSARTYYANSRPCKNNTIRPSQMLPLLTN